jgi:outer membrane protein assembly factor BamB
MAASSAASIMAVSAATTTSWPSFQGGPSHPGTSDEASFAPPLEEAWRLASPAAGSGLSGAAVVPGLAVATGRTSLIGFDPGTGRELWTSPRAEGPLVPPAIEEDPSQNQAGQGQADQGQAVVYVEGNSRSTSGLVAVEASTRRQRWRVVLPDLATGAPVIDADVAYATVRDGTVLAIDMASGSQRWRARVSDALASPAAAGGKVFVVSSSASTGRAEVTALDAVTGKRAWSYSPPGVAAAMSAATVSDGRVYVGFGDFFARALNGGTGATVWSEALRRDGDFSFRSAPAVADGGVFLLDRRGRLYRLDPTTGRRVWDFQFQALSQSASPVVVGETVYVGLDDGTVAGVDAATGHLRWHTRFRYGAVGALAPVGELLLVPLDGSGGGIIALRHDPDRVLLDEHSPTELNLPLALGNFGLAFLVVMAGLLGFFKLIGRGRRTAAGGQGTPEQADRADGRGEDEP